jgi:cytochrome aa3 quinol oxidase subunit IV
MVTVALPVSGVPHDVPPFHHAEPDDELGPGEGVEIAALAPRFAEPEMPWRQVAGFAGCLVLTFLALWAAARHVLPTGSLVVTILGLAVLQAAWQLASFMHLREGRGSTWHVVTLFFGIAVGLGIVGFSIWIMTFKSGVS